MRSAGKFALRPLEQRAVRHHARMAHQARSAADLDAAFLANHISGERHHAVPGHRNAVAIVPAPVAHGVDLEGRAIGQRRIEDRFPGGNPVSVAVWRRPVECQQGLLVFQPFHVAGRFASRRINRVTPVDRPNREAIVVVGIGVLYRPVGTHEWKLERRKLARIPCLRNGRTARPPRLRLPHRGQRKSTGRVTVPNRPQDHRRMPTLKRTPATTARGRPG